MEDISVAQAPTAEEFPMYANYRPDLLKNEGFIDVEISQLWELHKCCSGEIKTEQSRQRAIGNSLGELLYVMKKILALPGRAGKWAAWLRAKKIPRVSGDRMCARYAQAFNLIDELPHEAIHDEPTEIEIGTLLAAVWPRLERKLTTPSSRFQFLRCIAFRSGLTYDWRDAGIMIFEPGREPHRPESVGSTQEIMTGEYDDGAVL